MKITYIQTKGFTTLNIGKLVDAYVVTDVIHFFMGIGVAYLVFKYQNEIITLLQFIRQYFML